MATLVDAVLGAMGAKGGSDGGPELAPVTPPAEVKVEENKWEEELKADVMRLVKACHGVNGNKTAMSQLAIMRQGLPLILRKEKPDLDSAEFKKTEADLNKFN